MRPLECMQVGIDSLLACHLEPPNYELLRRLEFVSQSKLHHARIGQQTAEAPKRRASIETVRDGLHVEARQVQHVEHFPAELQAVRFPRHCPAFAETHV